MKILICFMVIVAIFYVIGSFILSATARFVKEKRKTNMGVVSLIGAAVMICVSQILCIFFSTTIVSILWWIVLAFILLFWGKGILFDLCNELKKYKFFLIGIIIVFSFLAFPMIKSNELLSYQYQNNDILFYLSTMDWLKDHNLLAQVQFTQSQPYYICAKYIFSTTRFGMDILGSVLMQMLGLDSYQIFTFLGIVFILICGLGIHYFLNSVLLVSNNASSFISLIAILNFSWRKLLVLQYIPQILGISFLIMFIALTIQYLIEKDDSKELKILSSLFLVATASVYAEFASYMFIIFIGFIAIQIIYSRKPIETIKNALQIGILSIILNPLGFWIAVKFNLNILSQVSNSVSSIDAYGGNIKSIQNILTELIGGPDTAALTNSTMQFLYNLFLLFIVFLFVFFAIHMLIKDRSKHIMFIMWIIVFFIGYECYFHLVRLAYGEFKHLVSVAAILILFMLYFIYRIGNKYKRNIVLGIVGCMIIICNLGNYKISYPNNVLILYDDTLADIDNGLKLVPDESTLGLLGNDHYIQHQLIYATKSRNVQLMGEGVNSYCTMLGIELDNSYPEYILFLNNSDKLQTTIGESYEVIWNNSRFMIVKCS